MKHKLSIIATSLCVSPAFLFSAMKQKTQQYTQEQNAPQEEEMCGESKRPMRVTARHIESNGIGYNQGYTTLEGFFSPLSSWGVDENWVPFADLRGHAFNDGKFAANAGLGLRYISNYVYGINAYYDYRNTHRQHYNQFAAGLEALGKIWDFRINGYLPLGRRNSNYYQTSFAEFKKHSIFLSRKKEVSLKGANAEVGYHLDHFEDFPFYFAGGAYYLHGTGRTAWGGQLRARVDIYDYLTLDGNISYDHIFRWVGQGQVSVNIPFGARRQIKKSPDRSCSNSMALSTRALQRVDRFEIIPVDHKKVLKKAIDPVTGDPYVVWFVDNTSHSLGTYESPFNTLVDAQNNSNPNDIIYVFPGDGTDNGMNAGIALKNGQQLFGAGIDQQIATTFGSITIPAQANALPVISNTFSNGSTGYNAVYLTQGDNVVSGFKLVDNLGGQAGPNFFDISGGVRVDSGLNYVIKNNIASTFGNSSLPVIGGNGFNVFGGGNVIIANNTAIARDGTTDTLGINITNSTTPFQGFYIIKNNVITGADENSGFASGIVIEPFDISQGPPGIIGDLNISIIGNICNSQTNSTPSGVDPFKSGILIAGFAPPNNPITWTVNDNYVDLPAGLAAMIGGIVVRSHGPGTFIVSLHDNTAITIPSVPGYLFDDFGNPAFLQLDFGSDNVGTRSGP